MSKYRTAEEYKAMIKNMSTTELVGLADTFNDSQTLNSKEVAIKEILNAEVERRIYNWEMTTV